MKVINPFILVNVSGETLRDEVDMSMLESRTYRFVKSLTICLQIQVIFFPSVAKKDDAAQELV